MDILPNDRSELVRIAGEMCAEQVIGLCKSLAYVFADPRTELALPRARAKVCADLSKVGKAASALRELVGSPAVALLLAAPLERGRAPSVPAYRYLPPALEGERIIGRAAGRLDLIALEMGELCEAAELAGVAYAPRAGPPIRMESQMLIAGLASICVNYGIPIGSGNDSPFVNVARWAFGQLDIGSDGSDARDTVRRMVDAGLIQRKRLAPVAAKRASKGRKGGSSPGTRP